MVDVPTRREFDRLFDLIIQGQAEIKDLIAAQNGRVRGLEIAVAVIQAERAEEAKVSIKRGGWAGIYAAAGLTAAWEVLRFFLHIR